MVTRAILACMNPIALVEVTTAARRTLRGALPKDPVVPDRTTGSAPPGRPVPPRLAECGDQPRACWPRSDACPFLDTTTPVTSAWQALRRLTRLVLYRYSLYRDRTHGTSRFEPNHARHGGRRDRRVAPAEP